MKELLVKINNQVHRFGYMSDSHKQYTLQDISQGMSLGIQYLRDIKGSEIIFELNSSESEPLKKGVNLREFSQLVALGFPTQKLVPYIRDDGLPKVVRELRIGEPFNLVDDSGTANIRLIASRIDITRGYGTQTTVDIEAIDPASTYCHMGCGPETIDAIYDARRYGYGYRF